MPVRWSGLVVSALSALVALALSSCSTPRLTELVVVVELGDGLEVPRDLVWLEIRADTLAGQVLRETVPFTGPDARGFPLTLGIRHAEDRGDRIEILVNGYATEDTPSISRLVATRFIPGDRRVVHVVLERACYIVECGRGLTCRGGTCGDPSVDPETLPRFYGQLPDAGPDLDGGLDGGGISGGDSGLDAAGDDAGPDAPRDASTDASFDTALDARSCEGDAGLTDMPSDCTLKRPPARMTCGDGGDDGMVRNFALIDPVVDQSGGVWSRIGYDLDGLCTNPLTTDTPTECDSPLGDPPQADGPGGIDNVVGQTVYIAILTFVPEFQRNTTEAALAGRSVPILRLSEWNGLADDARVRVEIAAAVDVLPAGTAPPPGGIPYDNDLPEPAWDGTDTAYAGANYFVAGDESFPIILDDNAYVTNHMLVGVLPSRAPLDFPVPAGVGRVRLTDPRFVATISPDGRSLTDATLMGRWGFTDMLSHLGDIGVCAGTPDSDMYLAAFHLVLQRVMDVRSLPGSGGPGVPCDAISAAIPFERGVSVSWGGVQPLELNPTMCP